jgi:hypothetical protein
VPPRMRIGMRSPLIGDDDCGTALGFFPTAPSLQGQIHVSKNCARNVRVIDQVTLAVRLGMLTVPAALAAARGFMTGRR